MKEYHKIQTVFKRDISTNYKTLIEGDFSISEFEYLKDNEWVFTEKVDGTNIRVIFDGGVLSFAGKTDNAEIPLFLLKRLGELFTVDRMVGHFGEDVTVCLYGEGYGAKIQKGGGNYISDGVGFILFDVLCGTWWLKRDAIEDVADKFKIPVVPIIGSGSLLDAVEMVRHGFNSHVGSCIAEGLVMRPSVELFDRGGNRVISKVKYKDFVRQ